MASRVSGIQVDGVSDVVELFEQIGVKHAQNLMIAANYGAAAEFSKEIKQRVSQFSDTGNLKRSIKTRRRKSPKNAPVADSYFSQGKGVKNDGFYWRFVEHGTAKNAQNSGVPARPFVEPARLEFQGKIKQIMDEQFTKKLAGLIKREQKKRAKRGVR